MPQKEVFILSAKRTPLGCFQGALGDFTAPQLGAKAISASLKEAKISGDEVDECLMGQVLTAGSGQAPARQAALYAQLPQKTPCLTVNKVCGSGLKAVMLGFDSLVLGRNKTVVAGGQESMTQAPHLLMKSREGYRLGGVLAEDSILKDGLLDPYDHRHMGQVAEACAQEFQLTREAQDEFAQNSYQKAQEAQVKKLFQKEIVPVEVSTRKSTFVVDCDEEPSKVKFDKISKLKPVFEKDGTITAANASTLNDGAAALVLSVQSDKALARVVSQSTYAQDPQWFTTAPIFAIEKLLKDNNLKKEDIDLWEINEAFSCVTLAAIKKLDLDKDKVNVHGGAVSLGHPIGASGARILTTLVHALHTYNKKKAVAAICLGGGEGLAVLVERV